MIRTLNSRLYSRSAKEIAATLNLPKTSFPLRVNFEDVENKYRETISTEFYQKQKNALGRPLFLIHDGPPFANGDLHTGTIQPPLSFVLGHALNKFLKDTILRWKIERGFRPAWDCHGLPIEQKALVKAQGKSLTALQLRKICQLFAKDAISRQASDMRRWGLLADYQNPIYTMDPEYEAAQLRVFGKFVKRGLVYTDKRPVYWSPSSGTALAEAELEYIDEHISKACLVRFPITGSGKYLLIWTTTPWTIPANQAIAINPNLAYVTVKIGTEEYVLCKSRIEEIQKRLQKNVEIIGDITTEEILRFQYTDLMGNINPVIIGDFVTDDAGTGLVHLSPAYGQDDFIVCRKNAIVEREIVDKKGDFTSDAPVDLVGKNVLGDGIQASIDLITSNGMLLHHYDYQHRYPYDWRTKKPVIQMATTQWFIRTGPIMGELQSALETVSFLPETGKKRFTLMLESRKEWCISRQRLWGVPIPVFYHIETNLPLIDEEIIDHVASIVQQKGTNGWWELNVADLLPSKFKYLADKLVRGNDTIDVWFDSGNLWNTTLNVSDVYIEGTDQYRGWFQSSFVTSVLARGISPFKKLIAHGFVLDEHGSKMSKSLGNVICPSDIITGGKSPRGTDVLRLWAISSNYLNDVNLGPELLDRTVEIHQKLRNTFRFILGNLTSFNGGLEWSQLAPLDQSILTRLETVLHKIQEHYDALDFAGGILALQNFVVTDLSASYFDIIKNRLYIESADSQKRQSCQTSLYHIATQLLSVLRPVSPFLCAEISLYLPEAGKLTEIGVESSFGDLMRMRTTVLAELNRLRKERSLESTYQAVIEVNNAKFEDLDEVLMVNSVEPYSDRVALAELRVEGLGDIRILRSEDLKCPRCWIYRMKEQDEICTRCQVAQAEKLELVDCQPN